MVSTPQPSGLGALRKQSQLAIVGAILNTLNRAPLQCVRYWPAASGSWKRPSADCKPGKHIIHKKMGFNLIYFFQDSRRVLQHQRCWEQNASRIHMLRHFDITYTWCVVLHWRNIWIVIHWPRVSRQHSPTPSPSPSASRACAPLYRTHNCSQFEQHWLPIFYTDYVFYGHTWKLKLACSACLLTTLCQIHPLDGVSPHSHRLRCLCARTHLVSETTS